MGLVWGLAIQRGNVENPVEKWGKGGDLLWEEGKVEQCVVWRAKLGSLEVVFGWIFGNYFLHKFLREQAFFSQFVKQLPDDLSICIRCSGGLFYPGIIYIVNCYFLYKFTKKATKNLYNFTTCNLL